ncbi:zinc finger protein C2H2-type protein [Fadolivirus algeromassiliense]|uniref:Zinc finger protein C2H2-type protein n=1 Tax=Fadolivirus FV1/VV64 TaxID=3070911 RepID=A0A7D3UQJ6_9VIRU|nr:zinc finger protein C2H2-type protein [Fadolivirus algeromassiliense]QKF93853.1 zinc finger protein C2H2-type protein [Fadolivirus FV1/VV64]
MVEHKCELCDYKTNKKSNLDRHLQIHNKNIKIIESTNISQSYPKDISNDSCELVCSYCTKTFTKACNLSRHKKSCSEKKMLLDNMENKEKEINAKLKEEELNNKMKELNNKIKELNNEIIHLKEITVKDANMILSQQSEIKNLRTLLNNAGTVVKTSVSAMSYIIKNYNEAPALETVKDIAKLHYDITPEEFISRLLYEYRHETLIAYIGDLILKNYKKTDPKQQSIWNSDTSRLTYIIRELINKNTDWRVDKKGIKTTKFIIEPVLDYITEQLNEYIDSYDLGSRDKTTKKAVDDMMNLKHSQEIKQLIQDKVLEEDILKYMAPYLYLVKGEELLLEE